MKGSRIFVQNTNQYYINTIALLEQLYMNQADPLNIQSYILKCEKKYFDLLMEVINNAKNLKEARQIIEGYSNKIDQNQAQLTKHRAETAALRILKGAKLGQNQLRMQKAFNIIHFSQKNDLHALRLFAHNFSLKGLFLIVSDAIQYRQIKYKMKLSNSRIRRLFSDSEQKIKIEWTSEGKIIRDMILEKDKFANHYNQTFNQMFLQVYQNEVIDFNKGKYNIVSKQTKTEVYNVQIYIKFIRNRLKQLEQQGFAIFDLIGKIYEKVNFQMQMNSNKTNNIELLTYLENKIQYFRPKIEKGGNNNMKKEKNECISKTSPQIMNEEVQNQNNSILKEIVQEINKIVEKSKLTNYDELRVQNTFEQVGDVALYFKTVIESQQNLQNQVNEKLRDIEKLQQSQKNIKRLLRQLMESLSEGKNIKFQSTETYVIKLRQKIQTIISNNRQDKENIKSLQSKLQELQNRIQCETKSSNDGQRNQYYDPSLRNAVEQGNDYDENNMYPSKETVKEDFTNENLTVPVYQQRQESKEGSIHEDKEDNANFVLPQMWRTQSIPNKTFEEMVKQLEIKKNTIKELNFKLLQEKDLREKAESTNKNMQKKIKITEKKLQQSSIFVMDQDQTKAVDKLTNEIEDLKKEKEKLNSDLDRHKKLMLTMLNDKKKYELKIEQNLQKINKLQQQKAEIQQSFDTIYSILQEKQKFQLQKSIIMSRSSINIVETDFLKSQVQRLKNIIQNTNAERKSVREYGFGSSRMSKSRINGVVTTQFGVGSSLIMQSIINVDQKTPQNSRFSMEQQKPEQKSKLNILRSESLIIKIQQKSIHQETPDIKRETQEIQQPQKKEQSFMQSLRLQQSVFFEEKPQQSNYENEKLLMAQIQELNNQIQQLTTSKLVRQQFLNGLITSKNKQIDQLKAAMAKNQAQLKRNKRQYIQLQAKIQSSKEQFIKSYNLFQFGGILDYEDYKERLFLIQKLQGYVGTIKNTKLIFKTDPYNKTNFHRYIDKQKHLVIIIKTIYGKLIAGYTAEAFDPNGIVKGLGLIMSLTKQKVFEAKEKRSIIYDDYYIIFGNSQIRLRSLQLKLFSNFGISNAYYENRGQKVDALLGEGSQHEVEITGYEIYSLELENNR